MLEYNFYLVKKKKKKTDKQTVVPKHKILVANEIAPKYLLFFFHFCNL